MMGKNIATTAVVVIAVLTCTTFLAPFGEAVNLGFGCSSSHHGQDSSKAPKGLKHLPDLTKEFHDLILVQLVKKCANKEFDEKILKDPIMNEEKERFCGNVSEMYKLLTEVDGTMQMWGEKRRSKKLFPILEKMPELVLADLRELKSDKGKMLMLNEIDKKPIEEVVKEITERRDNSVYDEFKKSVDALEAELKKTPTVEGQNTSSAVDKLAYKMLLINEETYHWTNQVEWAYRQFAANSLVYAIRLDARKSDEHGQIQKGDIQRVAHDWLLHIGMATYIPAY